MYVFSHFFLFQDISWLAEVAIWAFVEAPDTILIPVALTVIFGRQTLVSGLDLVAFFLFVSWLARRWWSWASFFPADHSVPPNILCPVALASFQHANVFLHPICLPVLLVEDETPNNAIFMLIAL